MGGLFVIIIFLCYLLFSTIFLCIYSLTIKLHIGKGQPDLIRIFTAGLVAFIITWTFENNIFSFLESGTIFFLASAISIQIFTLTYLTSYNSDTLSRPRNIFLLAKQKFAPGQLPFIYNFFLVILGQVLAFFIFAYFFVQE
jgi:hypothetical protein